MAAGEGAAFVLDAAAMTGADLSGPATRDLAGRLVLTPHAGEITGLEKADIERNPLSAARGVAAMAQAVVIMKGAETFIVSPDGAAWRHAGGAIGLATSGSGDVPAGVVAGLLARGASPIAAALWGVCVHGACGAG
jgi:ADP-dependent NAD(P)H-hydrate dehydratase